MEDYLWKAESWQISTYRTKVLNINLWGCHGVLSKCCVWDCRTIIISWLSQGQDEAAKASCFLQSSAKQTLWKDGSSKKVPISLMKLLESMMVGWTRNSRLPRTATPFFQVRRLINWLMNIPCFINSSIHQSKNLMCYLKSLINQWFFESIT